MKRCFALGCCIAVILGIGLFCKAGVRFPGPYCGVVIFDRWDGCILYSGIYVMYVSEKTKEGLRKYGGQAVKILAREVYQPENPGDGLIGKFEYLGAASKEKTRDWIKLEGIKLESSVRVGQDGRAIAVMTIRNKGKVPVRIFSTELGFTLLMKFSTSKRFFEPSDGPSFALITRQSFRPMPCKLHWKGKGGSEDIPFFWTIGKENALPSKFTIAPGKKKRIDILLDIPDGQYDFLCGYGGGVHDSMCLASNLSAFDVKNGKAEIVEIKDR